VEHTRETIARSVDRRTSRQDGSSCRRKSISRVPERWYGSSSVMNDRARGASGDRDGGRRISVASSLAARTAIADNAERIRGAAEETANKKQCCAMRVALTLASARCRQRSAKRVRERETTRMHSDDRLRRTTESCEYVSTRRRLRGAVPRELCELLAWTRRPRNRVGDYAKGCGMRPRAGVFRGAVFACSGALPR